MFSLVGFLFFAYQFWFPDPIAHQTRKVWDPKSMKPEQLQYNKECGDCHFDFHPSLLPAPSWKKVMNQLEDHFGDDASIGEQTRLSIENYLVKNAAETSNSEASSKIRRSIPMGITPIRITETPYWIRKHLEIKKEVYKRKTIRSPLNCLACHPYSRTGSFEDDDIFIPVE